ncbi:glycerol-3-phosphate 1-O-acyltransferase PlsY [Neptuniibacter sp. QD34_54]|uniref:glycerol-3-phosphate 1-O-acyltransferase PlsY n=1 Tax=Neptuniibacter sp. QD34_54 TaxID=3398208 RepID=UPI0039F5C4A2
MTESATMAFGLIFLAYLLGSIPTAVLVCRALNLPDPRQRGSGNPGATNVLRIGSKKAAILTLLGDISKGLAALAFGKLLQISQTELSYCLLAVVAGHIFPIISPLKGGKGVATAFGACIALYWPIALIQLIIWVIAVTISKISSLASIAAALITPVFTWIIAPSHSLLLTTLCLLLLYSHRKNIKKLLNGEEPRL